MTMKFEVSDIGKIILKSSIDKLEDLSFSYSSKANVLSILIPDDAGFTQFNLNVKLADGDSLKTKGVLTITNVDDASNTITIKGFKKPKNDKFTPPSKTGCMKVTDDMIKSLGL